MDLLMFCSLFIVQFVGHRLGDYFFQTNWQSINKVGNAVARVRHCLVYSAVVAALTLLVVDWKLSVAIFIATLAEHMWVDSRKPVVAFKEFLERKIAKTEDFKAMDLPFFVLIEIDQTFHYIRIFIISILIAIM